MSVGRQKHDASRGFLATYNIAFLLTLLMVFPLHFSSFFDTCGRLSPATHQLFIAC